MIQGSYGLVLCGGLSTRMKTDKSLLSYFGRPQWEHVHQLLSAHCAEVFISCNADQQNQFTNAHKLIVDDPAFRNRGPIASLLSAFAKFPHRDFLIAGCDYPFLSNQELDWLLSSRVSRDIATVFFNESENLYEPVIGWYSHRCGNLLMESCVSGNFSLQNFLFGVDARKYIPADANSLISVDTP
ncbi:MAG TPA: NTP transferase domain-containing protein, partial [Cyclobacteriaceae bacterium]|nr:NTP transferase domain-containing protein [Cyclobacteriaceae bacterium]